MTLALCGESLKNGKVTIFIVREKIHMTVISDKM